jgi:response regulator RpfG family c-di-GMP phosphodiesterase
LISIRPGIPIILSKGCSDENDVKRARTIMGVKGILMKPVARWDLAEMVRRVLDEVAEDERAHDSGQPDGTAQDEKRFKDQDNG